MSRILIHSNYAPKNFGGIEYVVSELIALFLDKGHDIICFYGGQRGDLFFDAQSGYKSVCAKIIFKWRGASFLWFGNMRFLWHSFRSNVVIFQEPYPTLWPALFLIKMMKKSRLVVLVHADPVANSVVRKIYFYLRKRLLSGVNVVTTSPQLLEALGVSDAVAPAIIPLGIPEYPSVSVASGGDTGRPYVLYFGRLAEYKGIQYLMQSILALPQINFVVAGGGELEDYVSSFIEEHSLEHVRFVRGGVSEEEKIRLIAGCRFLVFPSINVNEAFGIVQLEAMRLAKPIVNTYLNNGVNFVAPNGICALTCKPKDSQSLTDAISSLWDDESLLRDLSKGAERRFRELFTNDIFRASWASYLDEVIS
jgi:glycosyltransferase involved in cell wall biosynthesis